MSTAMTMIGMTIGGLVAFATLFISPLLGRSFIFKGVEVIKILTFLLQNE